MHFRIIVSALMLIVTLQTAIAQQDAYVVTKSPISSDRFDEFSPIFYEDGLVFVTTRKSSNFKQYFTTGNISPLKIYYVDISKKSKWRKAKIFSKNLTSRLNDGPATFSRSGDTIYFSRNMIVEGSIKYLTSIRNNLGIFYSVKRDGEWGKVNEFRQNIEWNNITTPALSPDGRRLYFSADLPGGQGGADLYYSELTGVTWGSPVSLGKVINTKGHESYPFMDSSGELYFSSDGHPGMGGKDIFVTKEKKDGSWHKPIALEAPVNSAYDDFGITTDLETHSGYFSSKRRNTLDIFKYVATSPRIWFPEEQKENVYCYRFADRGTIPIDTLLLRYKWNSGDGTDSYGPVMNHCFKGPGKYNVSMDVEDRGTGRFFFSKLKYEVEISDYRQAFISGPDYVVAGQEVEMDALTSNVPGYTIEEYFWEMPHDSGRFGDSVNYTFNETGESEIVLGLVLKSESTGGYTKEAVSKKVRAFSSIAEKERFIADVAKESKEDEKYIDFSRSGNLNINKSWFADEILKRPTMFQIVIDSSKVRIPEGSTLFKNLPGDYTVYEDFNPIDSSWLYIVDENITLMECYPAFTDMVKAGYKDVFIHVRPIATQAERDLYNLKKDYGVLSDTYFESNNRLLTDSYLLLNQVAKVMNQNPEIRLEISVHTDNTGTKTANLNISTIRAQLLVDYLVSTGMKRDRLVAKGYGESRPVANNLTEEGRRLNRRVDVRIIH